MGYFDNEAHVAKYIKMVEGYDGTWLIDQLRSYLKVQSTVLELGMGPGTDLDLLQKYFRVTGSDSSQVFVNRYKKMHPTADVLVLDATQLNLDRRFDCIYSNKVLIHLTKEECKQSLSLQKNLVNPGGIVFHTFWVGNKTEDFDGLLFVYYTKEELQWLFEKHFSILVMKMYKEFKKDDSIIVIAQKI